jgi:hypothetical protein
MLAWIMRGEKPGRYRKKKTLFQFNNSNAWPNTILAVEKSSIESMMEKRKSNNKETLKRFECLRHQTLQKSILKGYRSR